mmetsp:Transcript_23091/g.52385  ORF Transcript_23091/g.52385 Transcript_23091/m.52385 type:complete len:121 (-) Transcript_23091:835-1197(-)
MHTKTQKHTHTRTHTSHHHTTTPSHRHTVIPTGHHAITPSRHHAMTQSRKHAITQSRKHANRYGFSMSSSKFHYFDSMVQESVVEAQRDPNYGITHRFAWEHEVFANWSKAMPDRIELHQ